MGDWGQRSFCKHFQKAFLTFQFHFNFCFHPAFKEMLPLRKFHKTNETAALALACRKIFLLSVS